MTNTMDYNTYNLPGNYEESGKHSHLELAHRERDRENRTPQHYKICNIQSQLTEDAMVQSGNSNDSQHTCYVSPP